MDFAIKQYAELPHALKTNKNNFQTFDDFLNEPEEKSIILRHDVDLLPINTLRFY